MTTTKRSAKTTVIVDDSQTIVIGGLIQENNNEGQTQVPCAESSRAGLGVSTNLGAQAKNQSADFHYAAHHYIPRRCAPYYGPQTATIR